MNKLTGLMVALVLSGCSSAEVQTDEWCETHRCEVAETTFDPEPGLLVYTEAMIARISRATGRTDLAIAAGGIPVRAIEEMADVDGVPQCGKTPWSHRGDGPSWIQYIAVDPTPNPRCIPIGDTLVHEAIHALSPGVDHRGLGVFNANASSGTLDADALGALCDGFDCQTFNPE